MTVPSGCSGATLSFYLHVDTDETDDDHRVRQADRDRGRRHRGPYSNLDKSSGYVQKTLSIAGSGSKTVTFTGVEGSQLATAFVLDDVTLTPHA